MYSEDQIIDKFLDLQRSDYMSSADKERLEQFMNSYAAARSDMIRQLQIMKEIEVTKQIKDLEESILAQA